MRIIVIGAGLAGLSAAYELTQAGHDVTILEARNRAGGRVLTIRELFSDGLYAEAGAMWIPDNHDLTLKYIKLFDLSLDPVVPANLASLYYIQGNRIELKKGMAIQFPFGLRNEVNELRLQYKPKKYTKAVLKIVSDPTSSDWPPDSLRLYDQMTISEFLRTQGMPPEALELSNLGRLSEWGEGIDSLSALSVLRNIAQLRLNRKKTYRIKGGADLLPNAFAARLADKIRYGSPVVRIEHDTLGVCVIFLHGGKQQAMAADHLICAIPFSVLKHIEVSPPFSPGKQKAIEELPSTSFARIFLQSRNRFWIDQGCSGKVTTDLLIGEVDESTSNQPGPRGILTCSMAGEKARRIAAMKDDERIPFTLASLGKIYPEINTHYEAGFFKSWDEDEWARGAYVWFKPGQLTAFMPYIAKPEGRVHFAGDHTSSLPAWMQGAFASGNRAAREIIAA